MYRQLLLVTMTILCCTSVWAIQINPGQTMYDTDGNVLNAHGFDLQNFNGTWYWYGNAPRVPGCDFGCYGGINCYSSTDLINWHFEGMVQTPSGTSYLGTATVAYDPHVLYNSVTSKYVMILSECCAGGGAGWNSHLCFATSSTPNGTFTYQSWSKGANNSGPMDMGAFKDDDGSGYVIYSADNNGVAIDKLGSDYLSVASRTAYFGSGNCEEAPCMFKANARYFLYDSYCNGWDPNQGHYRTATNIAGPWSSLSNVGDNTTYNSQGTAIIAVTGTVGTAYVYVADRWNCTQSDCNYYRNSTYIFLPLTVNGTSMTLNWYDTWYLNASAGTWSLTDSTTVKPPFFSPVAGRYTSTQSVTLACSTSSVTIRYTTNGSNPTSSSTVYANPITVSQTTTIIAQAFKSGMATSDMSTAVYQIVVPGSDWTIFTNQTPESPAVNESQTLELGTKFSTTSAGTITALRFYKASGENGTHIGRMWSSTGTQLSSVTFANETSSGWQDALLSTPLAISVNTVYVVTVNFNTYYVATNNGLTSSIVNGPISTVADGANGVYGNAGTFPTQTYQNSNYFRDVVFVQSGATSQRTISISSPSHLQLLTSIFDIYGRRVGTGSMVASQKTQVLGKLGTGVYFTIPQHSNHTSSGKTIVLLK